MAADAATTAVAAADIGENAKWGQLRRCPRFCALIKLSASAVVAAAASVIVAAAACHTDDEYED
ncbi:MAG: hypothetical protein J6Z29_11760, partial [Ruminococcus sp.]|nr:hypothetical protein [Ruminococcus sp.]